MEVNSRVVFHIEDKNETIKAGHCICVLPADHEFSRHEKMMFLIVDSEETVEQSKKRWLQRLSDEEQAELEQDAERAKADLEVALANGGSVRDIDPPNPVLREKYKKSPPIHKIDLSQVDQTTLQHIRTGRQAIADNRTSVKVKATEKAQTKYGQHLGRELTAQEQQMTIEDIEAIYTPTHQEMTGMTASGLEVGGQLSVSALADKDQKISEIRKASVEGRHEIEYAAFDQLTEPGALTHTKQELDSLTL